MGWWPAARRRIPPAPRAPALLPPPGRRGGAFTADLHTIAAGLRQCQGTTVARASTGVAWIPLSALLEHAGCQGRLGAPRQGPRASNRPPTDVPDCPGLQRLHRRGLRTAACRPAEPLRGWRAAQRHRATRIADAGRHLQRSEQALTQKPVPRPAVVSDLTGLPGMRLIRAMGRGARAPQAWAQRRDHRGKACAEPSARALQGTWPPEPLLAFPPSLALYDSDHEQIRDGDRVSEAHRTGLA
jgi:transposase